MEPDKTSKFQIFWRSKPDPPVPSDAFASEEKLDACARRAEGGQRRVGTKAVSQGMPRSQVGCPET